MIGKAIRALLVADATVTGLVGQRIYPLIAPQPPTRPFVVYTVTGGDRWHSDEGGSGLASPRVQVNAYAETYAGAHEIAAAIRDALDGYAGTASDVVIQTLMLDQPPTDFYENEVQPPLYRVFQEYFVTYRETAAADY